MIPPCWVGVLVVGGGVVPVSVSSVAGSCMRECVWVGGSGGCGVVVWELYSEREHLIRRWHPVGGVVVL